MKMFAGHELKVLNLSVIVYIILGALIFHSLGEFDRRPTATTKFTTTTTSQRHNKSPNLSNGQQQHQQQVTPAPTDKGPAGRQTGSPNDKSSSAVVVANHHANRQDALARLQLIRLNSVRRMWNITNQLNILYESNWTELVLNELVNYERQFLESLERLAGEQSGDGDDNDDGGDYYYDGDDGPEDKHDNDDDGLGEANDEDKEKKKQKADETGTKKRRRGGDDRGSSGSSSAKRDSSVEHRVRLESIKKSLVHSLATITTMGSPIKPPESPLGRLLTILYGSLGIPLLVVTVAKSGQHLARTSLNGLLVLRHYCFALPLHYLCCSCNLFVCLRWLSWCCCCCCCSYLCCLADNKQKCCDYGNAPKLKLHKSGQAKSSGRSRRRAGSQQRAKTATQQTNKPPTLAETVNEGADQTGSGGGATTFVIGFNMNLQQELAANKSNKSEKQLAKVDQQKSVRFKGDPDSHYDSDQSSSSAGSSSSNPRLDEPEDQDPIDENEAWRLLISSLMVLVAYLAAGAYYHARQQNVPLVESLFTCYSMLATAKLPDSFNLDSQPQPLPPTTNPLQFYRAHLEEVSSRSSTGTPLARLERPSQQQEPQLASQMIQTHTSEPPQPSKTKPVVGDELTLIMDSIYLLIGLNLIAACAQFGRLWFDGTVKRRFKKACCHKLSPLSHLNCNGSSTNQVSASTSLMGSFEHQTSGGGVGQFVANQSLMGPTITSSHYDKQFSLAGLAPPSAVAATTGSVGGPADPIPLSTQNNPISLGELFVLGPDSGGPHDSSQPASSSPVSNYHSHHQQQLQQQQQQQLSDGASFASSSSQAGPRSAGSLCAHHQSTLVLQALAVNQPLDRQGCYSSSQHIHISSAEPTSPDEHQGPHHQHQHRHRNCYDSQANNMNIEHHDQQLLHQQQQHHSNSHHNHHQHHHHHQAELSDGSSQAGSANNNTKMRHSSSSIQLFEVPALLDGHEHAAAPNNQAYNPSPGYNSTATLTRRSHHNHNYSHNNQQHKDDNGHYSSSSSTNHHHHRPHDGGRTSASQTLGAVPLLPLTNGFAGNLNGTAGAGGHSSHNEQDSSPNTFDTNSQTMSSSMSSRAIVMKPIRDQQQQSMTKTTSSAGGNGEKTVSWLQSNNSGH